MKKYLPLVAFAFLVACGSDPGTPPAPETTGTLVMHWTSASDCSYSSPIEIKVKGPGPDAQIYQAKCSDHVLEALALPPGEYTAAVPPFTSYPVQVVAGRATELDLYKLQ